MAAAAQALTAPDGPATVAPPAPPEPLAAATPIPAATFFRNPDLAGAALSPNGRWLVVKMGAPNGRYALAMFDVAGAVAPKAIAHFNDIDVGRVSWVNDDRLVFDVVDLERGSGDARQAPGLFSLRRDGSEVRQLIQMRSQFVSDRMVASTSRVLSPAHGLLHIPTAGSPAGSADGEGTTGEDVIVGEFQWDSWRQGGAVVPKRLNVATGRVTTIARGIPRNVTSWLFDSAGAPRVAVVSQDGREAVHWRADASGSTREDWVELASAQTLQLPWSPRALDGQGQLLVTVAGGAAGERELRRFDFAGRQPEARALVQTPGFDFTGSIVSDADSGRMLGVHALTDAQTTVWLDPRLQRLQQEIDRRLPERVNHLSCRQCGGSDITVLVESWSDRDPGDYWLWRGEPDAPTLWRLIGKRRKDVDPARMATVTFQRFAARDGREIPLWVTLPPAVTAGAEPASATAAARKPAAVVMPHGGPWLRGGTWAWQPMAQFLASRGYVVIEPEYRGSAGFGADHFRAGWKQWGQAMQDDVADAVRWAAGQGLIDPQRVCIAGASYGGYAALMGLVRDPGLYRCGAAWLAVAEPALLLQGGFDTDVAEEARRYRLPQLLGDPEIDADARMLRAVSPVQQAARIRAPVLLAYGENDRRVPLVHGERMRAALRAAGQEPQWVVYPGEGHGWQRMAHRLDFARRLEAFLADNLR